MITKKITELGARTHARARAPRTNAARACHHGKIQLVKKPTYLATGPSKSYYAQLEARPGGIGVVMVGSRPERLDGCLSRSRWLQWKLHDDVGYNSCIFPVGQLTDDYSVVSPFSFPV